MSRTLLSVFTSTVAACLLQACYGDAGPTEVVRRGVLAASVTSPASSGRHVVLFARGQIPADFGDRVSLLGGSVEAWLDSIGVATVIGLTDSTATTLAATTDIQAVEADVMMALPDVDMGAADGGAADATTEALAPVDATATPAAAQFYARQWNLRAVFADQAWAAGQLGTRDVVVAMLDSGIDYTLPDFDGLVDLARSKSFATEEDPIVAQRFPGRLPISDLFWHGTATASIVASNGKVLAGVNRSVTILAVKIWNRFNQGAFSRLLAAIVYAVDQGADVINVSGSYTFDKSMNPGMVAAMNRAANYAFRKGALLVSVAGNDTADLDHNGDTVRLPCEAAHAICASATGPTSAAGVNGPWVNADAFAPYSAYGRSAVTVAAPGGAGDVGQFRRVWVQCTTTPTENTPAPCRAHQPVAQGQGTSFAAPHVSGLAALLVAQLGHGNPALIQSRILQSADDLGDPGVDPRYGKGRINIARALGLAQ